MNNILIIGRVKASDYADALLRYAEPEGLQIYTSVFNYNDELEVSVLNLNLGLTIIKEDDNTKYEFKDIICFTDRIGINEVMFLEEAIKEKVNVIFINPK